VRIWWRIRAPLAVAAARLRGHPARALLVAAGVATSVAALVAVDGGSVAARDRAVQQAVAELPASQRSLRVDAFGLAFNQTYAQADRTITRALATLTPRAPLRATFFRELRVGGGLVQLAGIDGLDSLVRVRSGRLPHTCTASRCEVLALGPGTRSDWQQDGIHLVRVGSGVLADRALFGDSLQAARASNGEVATILLANGSSAFEPVPAFAGLYRAYSWIAPLDPRHLHVWEISSLLHRESLAQDALGRYSDTYELSGPDAALTDAQSRGRVSAQRLLLLGGEAGTLLLGFALVAALGLRRGLAAERRRLLQRGARRPQLWLALGTEVSALTVGGALAGAAIGAVTVVLVARAAGLPAGAVLARSLGSWLGVGLVVGAAAVATAAVLAVAQAGETERRGRVRALDVAAFAAVVLVAVELGRGGLDASALASGGDAALLLLLPGLVCFASGVLAARLLAPAMRAAERAARRAPLSARLALLALARAPARTVGTTVFLLVGIGLALFAASYRATLERGARDEAAYAVPLDYALTEGTQLVPPPRIGYPVLRVIANVPGAGTNVLNPTVLGLPPAAIAELHWRSDYASVSQAELARRLSAGATLRGVPLHAGVIALPVRIRGVAVGLTLAVERAGEIVTVPLGEYGAGAHVLRARVPDGTLVGLEIALASSEQYGYLHREAEAGATSAPSGSLDLGALPGVTDWRGWVARGGATLAGARVSYAFDQAQTMLLRLPQVTDTRRLAVVVNPAIASAAGPGGTLTLDFQDQLVPAHIVAVARRFPDAQQSDEGFVVANESALATILDARSPGAGAPIEAWIRGPASLEPSLSRLPVVVASRRDLEHTLASDPLARALIATLTAAAVVALALAATGFWLALVGELRDERGELFDLEAQGVAPQTLRAQFRARAAFVLALGAAGGIVLGLLLSRLVVALVRVSAATQPAEPPLRFEAAWALAALGLLALVAVCAAIVELTSARAFRADVPERASWSLE